MKNEAEIRSKGFDLSDYDLLDHPALELFEKNSFYSTPLFGRDVGQESI
jgi:hypothetical protein